MRRLVVATALAIALSAGSAGAATMPSLTKCVTAWNTRGAAALHGYAAGSARQVRLAVEIARTSDVGGVRSVSGRTSTVQLCTVTIFRRARRITTISGVWIGGTVRAWKAATGVLPAGSSPARNARLLPDGSLRLS